MAKTVTEDLLTKVAKIRENMHDKANLVYYYASTRQANGDEAMAKNYMECYAVLMEYVDMLAELV